MLLTLTVASAHLRLHLDCQAWFQLTSLRLSLQESSQRSPPSRGPPDWPTSPLQLTFEGLALWTLGWLKIPFAGSPIVPVPALACCTGVAVSVGAHRDRSPGGTPSCPDCTRNAQHGTWRRGAGPICGAATRGQHVSSVWALLIGGGPSSRAGSREPGCVCACAGQGAGSVCGSGTCQKTWPRLACPSAW